MKFKMEIIMDNAAFSENPEPELSRILAHVSDRLIEGSTFGVLMDAHGNKVGSYNIEVD